ncbi:peptide chain release factor 3 [Chitinasiproducens palmae]|uniref:Peptide chain release factor 3 n=1 Tax=Chitinasiproducens palmae TaxID=1770053 RepID=A0A1H2PK23_9BURK|nr:peptide chain release factor 3 [Chitinasiproducens palmae]SDV46761.1 bacterial peptide chain release factor 3 (bRF-3) [Chitinasiproducens palmae]
MSVSELKRRRTFAVISHPDAGKTTLTEKLLLFSGAIQIAGTVKGRKSSRFATSDWMDIEKQRGISVASSVMQFEYGDAVMNLLDTPGHEDFSEDTYRVLTAVDAAIMVIDGANGVEAQTLKLLEVCRSRKTPIITFINKLDREVRQPLDLLDEIEQHLGVAAVPFTWPIGMGKEFQGVYDIRHDQVRVFRAGQETLDGAVETLQGLGDADGERRFGPAWLRTREEVELITGASPAFDKEAFLRGDQSPVLFGSAINNFGVKEILDTMVELAPPPSARMTVQRPVDPAEPKFTGVVFKVQANMDLAHRDRVAFIRVCSGRFERGMALKVSRTGKTFRANNVVAFLSQRRETISEAYPGDIIGIPNHGTLSLGDTLTEGEDLQFIGLPFFAPEIFQTIEVVDPMRAKQLGEALRQFGDEGAIQVFRPVLGGSLVLGAVGQLQFEVVKHRLAAEYKVEVRISPARYRMSRWVTCDDPAELRRFSDSYAARMALDAADAPTYLATHGSEIEVAQKLWPKIVFNELRERSGQPFKKTR